MKTAEEVRELMPTTKQCPSITIEEIEKEIERMAKNGYDSRYFTVQSFSLGRQWARLFIACGFEAVYDVDKHTLIIGW